MEAMKEQLIKAVDARADELVQMADHIFDLKEVSYEEVQSSALLEGYLEANGFQVEKGVGELPTAFRAVYQQGEGGPSIGLLCEYDALASMGHGCAHHLQGPGIVGAACAIKEVLQDRPYRLVVYGTPGEETTGGKITMVANGCFQDIDVALMIHGGDHTQVDVKSMALVSVHVTFHGVAAHAAISPEKGRSALDAMVLMFNGTEFLREHIKEDSRIHYTVNEVPGAQNSVPALAKADYDLRSYNSLYLDEIIRRFENIVKGAALMTDTTYEIQYDTRFESKVPARHLNALVMANAEAIHSPAMAPAREKTGSTDFGNVLFHVPGTCLRVAFVDSGTASHSEGFIRNGKTERAHAALLNGAKTIAMTACDLIEKPEEMEAVKAEFAANKAAMQEG
jgi:amidohydrolase